MVAGYKGIRSFVATLAVVALAIPVQADEPEPRRPNVVLIVADDLGYADLGCHGCPDIPTPRIDSLAADGLRCTQGYVTASVCVPSRAALLTGRYAQRFGFEHNAGAPQETSPDFGLPRDVVTLPDRLSGAGYATGLIGKWHLGHGAPHRPTAHGFGSFFGFLGGSRPHLPSTEPGLFRGDAPVTEDAYLTDALAREAVAFVDRHKSSPFFLVLAFGAVHVPLEVDDARLARLASIRDPRRRAYAGMLTAMDEAVGAVLDELASAKLAADTLVVFISDNGGATTETTANNAPLRGEKGTAYEGGVRVPFLVRWPGRAPAGTTYAHPVSTLDLAPTVLAAARIALDTSDFDGRDLAPHWSGARPGRPHDALFWKRGAQLAARVGDLKMVADHGEPPQLFDLARDPSERENLAERHPEKLSAVRAVYDAWDRQNRPATWTPERAAVDPPHERAGRDDIARHFRRADVDGDGRLSRDELAAIPQVRGMLEGADVSGDGLLSLDEVVAHMDARSGPRPIEPVMPAPGEPFRKAGPDNDAGRDAAGRGQLFESVHVTGFTFIRDGMNGLALGDMDRDGRVDLVATYPPRSMRPGVAPPDQLCVFLNRGGFTFEEHPFVIEGSSLAPRSFGYDAQAPHLVDLNGDGFLDVFVCRGSPRADCKSVRGARAIGNTLLVSNGAWDRFVDRSVAMGITNVLADNRRARFADVDGDGWLDLAIGCENVGNATGGLPHHRLYRFVPRGSRFEDGAFEDIGGSALAPDFGGFHDDPAKDRAGPGIELVDLDHDGDPDLVQSCHAQVFVSHKPYSPGEYRQGIFCWKNLRAETGAFRFERVTDNGLACEGRLQYDRKKRVFTPASPGKAPGLPVVALADVDNDGRCDLLAVGPSDPTWFPRTEDVGGRLWRNLGSFRFEEATARSGLASLDFATRRWNEFFDCPIAPENLRERPGPQHLSGQPGLPPINPLDTRPYFADAVFGDFDNDGWVDLVVVDRRELGHLVSRPILYMNRGDGVLEPKTTAFSGLDGRGIAAAAADLNDDGRVDLVLSADPMFAGPKTDPALLECAVYWNAGSAASRANHWLRVRCGGPEAARAGARVEVRDPATRALVATRLLGVGGEAHVGLGARVEVNLRVILASGKVVEVPDQAVDRVAELDLTRAR